MRAILAVLIMAVAMANGADNQCPPEQEEDWTIEKLLRHEDCNKFYKCTFGKPVVMQCPADLYFNLETWQCDWKQNVDCTDRNVPDETTTRRPITTTTTTTARPTTTTTTTARPTTTTTTTARPTTTTTTTARPTTTTTTTARPTTTTTTTARPTTTTTTTARPTTTTTTTARPTTTTTTTARPTTTTTTTARPTTTTTTTARPTTPRTTTTTARPSTSTNSPYPDLNANGCPVDPHIHWLLPHERNCNQFYYCVWGKKVLRNCPSTLHFNRRIQVCDWPNNAGCTTSFNKHLDSRKDLIASF